MKSGNFATLEAAGVLNRQIQTARESLSRDKTSAQKDALKNLENLLESGEDENTTNSPFEQMQDFLE